MKRSMRLILDTNEYVFGFDVSSTQDAPVDLLDKIETLLHEVEDFSLFIPDIIRDEVQRNMPFHLIGDFYRFITSDPRIVQFPVVETPISYFQHYHLKLGLKEADATIAAFAEWKTIDFLVSENRHFLSLNADQFVVCNAARFVQLLESGEVWEIIHQTRDRR